MDKEAVEEFKDSQNDEHFLGQPCEEIARRCTTKMGSMGTMAVGGAAIRCIGTDGQLLFGGNGHDERGEVRGRD